jgi:DNA-binding transcriptional MerR regulator
MKKLTIGLLAKRTDVGVQTIRFYERLGLLPKPKRKESGYRQYDAEDVVRVRFIRSVQGVGFSLNSAKELLNLGACARTARVALKRGIETKIAEVEAKIEDLQRLRRALKKISSACDQRTPVLSGFQLIHCFESAR